MKIANIKNSGTSGTESGVINAAKSVSVNVCGWKSKGSEVNNKSIIETPLSSIEQCIIWNTRDSHATLILNEDEDINSFFTTALAYDIASVYERPVKISDNPNTIIKWLNTLGEELTIHVIGPSEKEKQGSEKHSNEVISKVFKYFDQRSI